MILITSYENPDLDGTACIFAYSELLKKQGREVEPGIFGMPHREALFVLDKLKLSVPAAKAFDKVILVDASDTFGISDKINPADVIEIIDHRKMNQVEKFPNATVQLEFVGAAATLVAERFQKAGIEPSEQSKVLLYSAIVSNTINFKNMVTTDRDRKVAEWLNPQLPGNFVQDMFVHKSKIDSVRGALEGELSNWEQYGFHLGVSQLEIVDAEEFVKKNFEEIKSALISFKKKYNLTHCFLIVIDTLKAYNIIVCFDDTLPLLEKTLNIKFENNVAKTDHILMRKEICPKLWAALAQQASAAKS